MSRQYNYYAVHTPTVIEIPCKHGDSGFIYTCYH